MADKYKILITTSGFGQRLGEITKYTNKALVRIGKKPAISYIVDSYPQDVEIVITLRHFGEQLIDFLQLAYPERKFTFVVESDVPKNGEVFSLGNSMLSAKKYLNCPFIFHCCDTIMEEKIPPPDTNWTGVHKGLDSAQYSSVTVQNGKVQKINPKGALNFDYLHIGLVGIKDYKEFWHTLETLFNDNPLNASLNDCDVINAMLKKHNDFLIKEFKTWHDTGNVEGLHRARENISDKFYNLEKLSESLFLFDDFAIKFFYDESIVRNRVARGKVLNGLVPNIQGTKKNFYKYEFVQGDLYSRVVNPEDFKKFLNWSKKNLWKKNNEIDDNKFPAVCNNFYHKKTLQRIESFFEQNDLDDSDDVINSEKIPRIKDVINEIDFDWLCNNEQYQIHGDFILDNILKLEKGYCLLDWRQDFGGLLKSGDIYYDFAKLNHNLTVNHDIIKQNLFTLEISENEIFCDILRKENLVQCQKVLQDFIVRNSFDSNKVDILTGIIWLNMSSLHHYPFNLFLFYFGKLNLWRALKQKVKQ